MRFLDLLSLDNGAQEPDQKVIQKLEQFQTLLVAEMVIIYGRVNNHEGALRLLVEGLRDFDGCIEYCFYRGRKPRGKLTLPTASTAESTSQEGSIHSEREEQRKLFEMLLVETLKMDDIVARQEWVEMLLERWGGWLDVTHVSFGVSSSWT